MYYVCITSYMYVLCMYHVMTSRTIVSLKICYSFPYLYKHTLRNPCFTSDFGVDVLSKMAAQCNFPWLMSNVYDNFTEKPLANGLPSHLIEWQGHKV